MTLRLRCPDCRAAVLAPETLEGKTVRCPKCKTTFRAVEDKTASAVVEVLAPPRPSRPARPVPPAFRSVPPRTRAKAPPHRAFHPGLIIGGALAAVFLLLMATLIATAVYWARASANPAPRVALGASPDADVAVDPGPHDNSPFHLADVRKSVVFVRTSSGVGSGFIVGKDGMIATNRHVIQAHNAAAPHTEIFVGVPSIADPDVLEYFKAKVAYCSPPGEALDFALLKIAAKPGYPAFRPLPLASTKLALGEPAAAIGFPFAAVDQPVLSFNKGSISASRVEFDGKPYYQTDAAVNPGNSGGPLINTAGEAVGIVTLKLTNASNMGYALFLSETGMPAVLNQDRFVAVQPELGPITRQDLPAVGAATPVHKENWQIVQGQVEVGNGHMTVDNNGGPFLLTSKEALPENFALMIECKVDLLQPPNLPAAPQANRMRSLYVRFGTDATDEDIHSMKSGVTVHLSTGQIQLGQDGVVSGVGKRMPENSFMLAITRRGSDLSVVVDGNYWMRQSLGNPPSGSHKFSIGGDSSRLSLRSVRVVSLPAPGGPPVVRNNPRPGNPPFVNPPQPEGPKREDGLAPAAYKGPAWIAEVANAKFPDKPAAGWLKGGEFVADEATLDGAGFLTIRQGKQFEPGAYVLFMGLPKSLQELEGKTFNVAGKQEISHFIWAHAGRTFEGEKLPKVQIFGEYNMKLEFGKIADSKLPAKIYLCLPDASKSVVAGKFTVESR